MGWVPEFEFQWVLVITSAAPAETSTQVQFPVSSHAQTAVHTHIEIPAQQEYGLQTHSLKEAAERLIHR